MGSFYFWCVCLTAVAVSNASPIDDLVCVSKCEDKYDVRHNATNVIQVVTGQCVTNPGLAQCVVDCKNLNFMMMCYLTKECEETVHMESKQHPDKMSPEEICRETIDNRDCNLVSLKYMPPPIRTYTKNQLAKQLQRVKYYGSSVCTILLEETVKYVDGKIDYDTLQLIYSENSGNMITSFIGVQVTMLMFIMFAV